VKIFKRIFPALLSLIVFVLIIYYTPYPRTWYSASVSQILLFFIPLLVFLTFFLNIFINFYEKSFSLSLGLLILIVLRSIDELNIITGVLTLLAAFLLSTTFKKPLWKPRQIQKGLTSPFKISKLTRFERKKQK